IVFESLRGAPLPAVRDCGTLTCRRQRGMWVLGNGYIVLVRLFGPRGVWRMPMRDVTSPTASSGGQQSAKPCSALFLGAHADDIEIGCGGTLAKMVALGWDVWMCVVTDDADRTLATTRRHEAQASAAAYGIPAAQVLFLGAPDTQLRCDGETVGALRR